MRHRWAADSGAAGCARCTPIRRVADAHYPKRGHAPLRRWPPTWMLICPQSCTRGTAGCTTAVDHSDIAIGSRLSLSAQIANLVAMAVSTIFNTAANRRYTFSASTECRWWAHQLQGFLVMLLALAITSSSLTLLHFALPDAATWTEVVALNRPRTYSSSRAIHTSVVSHRWATTSHSMFVGSRSSSYPRCVNLSGTALTQLLPALYRCRSNKRASLSSAG